MPEAGRLCELIIPVVSGVKEQSAGPRHGSCPSPALSEPGRPSASRQPLQAWPWPQALPVGAGFAGITQLPLF